MMWAYVLIAVGCGLICFGLGMFAGQYLEQQHPAAGRPSISDRLATSWVTGEHHIVPKPLRNTGRHLRMACTHDPMTRGDGITQCFVCNPEAMTSAEPPIEDESYVDEMIRAGRVNPEDREDYKLLERVLKGLWKL